MTTVTADENGGFLISGAMAGNGCGQFYQAVDLTTCAASNVTRLASGYPAPAPKTGQTAAYNIGDDGWWGKGVDWPDPRFTDNLDGTVTDRLTGLIWLQNASCFDNRNYADALDWSKHLSDGQCGLTDDSAAGDWRLPNVRELQSLVDWSEFSQALPRPNPFSGVKDAKYWSSTATTGIPLDYGWTVSLEDGSVRDQWKPDGAFVWAVRGGE